MTSSSMVDLTEVSRLVADLKAKRARVGKEIRDVASKGGLNIKTQMQAEAAGVTQALSLPRTITYEVTSTATSATVEVGPRRGGAGSLALFYFGNDRIGAPRVKDPRFALEREMTPLQRYLADVGAQLR